MCDLVGQRCLEQYGKCLLSNSYPLLLVNVTYNTVKDNFV